jgi:hypothetical protein
MKYKMQERETNNKSQSTRGGSNSKNQGNTRINSPNPFSKGGIEEMESL